VPLWQERAALSDCFEIISNQSIKLNQILMIPGLLQKVALWLHGLVVLDLGDHETVMG